MKIYIAAAYARMDEMKNVDRKLTAAGHECVSQWVWGGEEEKKLEASKAEDGMRWAAKMDFDDVRGCDAIMSFTAPRALPNGKSMHTELGLAIAWRKVCIFIGPKGENIFHYLPPSIARIEFFDTVEDFLGSYPA